MSLAYFTIEQNLLLFTSCFLIITSVISFNKNAEKWSLIFLTTGALAMGFFIALLDPFLILWDEQFHALVAKNMICDPLKPTLYLNPILPYNYQNWTANHIWVHKQPLFLWQIALSLKVFGINELAVRIPSIIMHAVIPVFVFRIGKVSINKYVGFYGALFFATSYFPLELVAGKYSTDHNDVAFLFYFTASFWAWFEYQNSPNKLWIILIGVFSGFSVLVKWLMGLLIYCVWCIVKVTNKESLLKFKTYKQIALSLIISIIIFLPWQFYIFINYPLESTYETLYNGRHLFEALEGQSGGFLFHWDALKKLYGSGDAVRLLILIGVIFLIRMASLRPYKIALAVAIIIVYAFYSIAATKMVAYCIIVSPFIFLGIGALVYSIQGISMRFLPLNSARITSFAMPVIVCYFLLNLSKIQNYHTLWKPHDNQNRSADLLEKKVIESLTQKLPNDNTVVFNTNITPFGHIPVMFYTNYIAYDFIPSETQVKEIIKKGFHVAVFNHGKLPDYILKDESIIKIKVTG